MLYLVILSFLIFSDITPTSGFIPQPQGKIFLGHKARAHEFPWIVRISDLEGQFICAGSILSKNWILTASHCLVLTNPELLSIVPGDHDLRVVEGTEYYHRALRVITHPEFSEDPIQNDIALIKVFPSLTFDDTVKSISLPPQFHPDPEDAILAGWGYTEKSSSVSSTLNKAILPIIPINECIENYWDTGTRANINEKTICAGNYGLCKGDSGGALYYLLYGTPVVYGISSFGTFCGDDEHPGVYTRVASHLDFILKYVDINYLGVDISEEELLGIHTLAVNNANKFIVFDSSILIILSLFLIF